MDHPDRLADGRWSKTYVQGTSQQGTSQQGTPQQGTSQQGTSQQGTPQQGTPQQGTSQQGTPQQGTPQQGTSQQGMSQQGTSRQGTPQQGTSQQGTSQQGTSRQGTPQQGTSQQGMSQQGTSRQGTPQQGTSQQGTPQQGMSQQELSHTYLPPWSLKNVASELQDELNDPASEFPSSVWNFSKQVGKWKKNQTKNIQFEETIQGSDYKEFLKSHELELKAKLPLPLITTMEQEVLHILEATIKDYQRYLGPHHNLTQQMRHRIHELRLMIERKGILDEQNQGRCQRLAEFFRQFLGTS